MPRPEPAVDERRHRRQLHDRLGDPGARVVEHLDAQLVELGPGRGRPDHDALAARAVDRLEHQLVEPVEDLLARLRLAHPPGVDVAEHRLLGEVVADDVGQVGVDELVVGDPVADRVGERDVAGPGGVDQPRGAEHRVGPEVHRVEELVVDPAVDHVHRLEALGGPHHHPAAAALEVAALDQLDAHRAGQQRVLEVGAVVDARGQYDDGRVGDAGRRRGPQGGRAAAAGSRPPDGSGARRSSPAARRRSRAGWSSRRTPRTAPGRCPRAPGTRPRCRGSGRCRTRARGRRSAAGRWRPRGGSGSEVVITARGITPSSKTCPASYTSARKRSSARTRCWTPWSIVRPGVHLDDPRQDVERERALLAADVEGDALVEIAGLQRLDPVDQVGGGHRGRASCAGAGTAAGARPRRTSRRRPAPTTCSRRTWAVMYPT